MKWFRFYDEVLDDPKCQRLTPVMFRHWINVLCLANRSKQRGILPSLHDVAFGLRLSEAKAQQVIDALVAAELLDANEDGSYAPHGWAQRQRSSDNIAERVQKHRSKSVTDDVTETESTTHMKHKRNVTETFPHVRATEADTEADTETEGVLPPNPPAVADAPASSAQPAQKPVRTERQRASDRQYERTRSLFAAWCRGVGIDPDSPEASVGQGTKFKQLRPIADAATPTPEDFERCAHWCRSQSWRDGVPNPATVVGEYAGWVAQGRPATAKPRSPIPIRGAPPAEGYSTQQLLDKARELESRGL